MPFLQILNGQVSSDEGSYLWEVTAELSDINDYALLRQDDPFDVEIYGEIFKFILDSKELDRSNPAQLSANITGLSPGAIYDFPRAQPYTKTWDTPVSAKAAAEAALGVSITWNILDWTIPAFRLAVENVSPISVVIQIAEAAGGIVESDIDGSILVRHKFPVSVADYDTATPDHSFTEEEHILSVSEQFVSSRVVNKLRLLDVESDYSDVIEYVKDPVDRLKGELRAYPSPWRTGVGIIDTAQVGQLLPITGDPVLQSRIEAGSDELGELVEIVDGIGTTNYPISSIGLVEWVSESLGGVSFEEHGNTVSVANPEGKYGLVKLTYTVEYYSFPVESLTGDPAQFLMEDTTEI